VSGQSRQLLAERFRSDDRPRIPDNDELLEALKREFGEDGRDLVIPRATMGLQR